MRNPFTMWQFWALFALGVTLLVVGLWGMTRSNTSVITPRIARNQHVVIEIDPNDSGTATFHCHSHAITGAGHSTFVFTHCEHGLG